MLEVSAARAFRDNYIWLIHAPADPSRVVAVDPGDARPVEDFLARKNLTLAAILATHHHHDHVGGIKALCAAREVPVFGPRGERVPACSCALGQGDKAELPELGLAFEVLEIPGHTAGHIAFAGHGALFCGDTLFSAGCGRLFEGTPAQMVASLGKLAALPDETAVYCGHEYTLDNLRFALTAEADNEDAMAYRQHCQNMLAERQSTLPSTMGLEKRVNPFLRCDQPAIRASVAAHAGREPRDTIEVFAELRTWKDHF